jgi:hypothetical protein
VEIIIVHGSVIKNMDIQNFGIIMNRSKYSCIINIERLDKDITFFLEKGESLNIDNIVDVEVYPKKTPWVNIENRNPKEIKAYWIAANNPRSTMLALWDGEDWLKIDNLFKSGKISHWMAIPDIPDEKINK